MSRESGRSGFCRKKVKQVVFRGSEFDLLAAPRDDPALDIDLRVRERDHALLLARRPAQNRADARQQFPRAEGLHDIIVRAHFEQQDFIDLFSHRAQHDDRRLDPGGAEALADLDAAQIGQAKIGQNQRRLAQDRLIEAALAVGRENGPESLPFEQHADGVAKIFVVVNNKDGLHRHGDFNLYRCARSVTRVTRQGNLQLFYKADADQQRFRTTLSHLHHICGNRIC